MRGIALLAALVVLASCGRGEPLSRVRDLNWACGTRSCAAKFRVANDGGDDETLVLLVRAYSGDSVANRRIVGEHREALLLPAGRSQRFTVSVQTTAAASRLRVILERGN
jgi:hypothetical protein